MRKKDEDVKDWNTERVKKIEGELGREIREILLKRIQITLMIQSITTITFSIVLNTMHLQ